MIGTEDCQDTHDHSDWDYTVGIRYTAVLDLALYEMLHQ